MLEIIVDNNDVLEYVQGKLDPLENSSIAAKKNYKKDELKEKKIIVDDLQYNLHAYVGTLRKSKDTYDNIASMYEVKNLNEITSLKDQLKPTNMKKEVTMQSYIMRISCLRYQLKRVGNL